ncbi:MAG: hypothetical protein WCI04_04995 [archaeon]
MRITKEQIVARRRAKPQNTYHYRGAGPLLWQGKEKVKPFGINEIIREKLLQDGKGNPKALIARDAQISHYGKTPKAFTLVYYPKPSDGEAFRRGSGTTIRGSPGMRFLGSVGSLRINPILEKDQLIYKISYMQGHTKSGKKRSPPRSLVTKYGGWRSHLLEIAFEEAEKNRAKVLLALRNPKIFPKEKAQLEARKKEFTTAAKKAGFVSIERVIIDEYKGYLIGRIEIIATKKGQIL